MKKTEDSNNFFDISLSFGSEVKTIQTAKNVKAPALPDSQVFYNKESEMFLESYSNLLKFEVERKIGGSFANKSYIGSWNFKICDDHGNPVDGAADIEGAIYITDVFSHLLTKSGNYANKGFEWHDIKLIDIIFLGVERNYVANVLDNAQHRFLTLSSGKRLHDMLQDYYSLHIITPPKSLVSYCSDKPFVSGSSELISILGHQTLDTDIIDYKLICKNLSDASFENISDYENLYIIISNCNVTQQFSAGHKAKNSKVKSPKISVQTRYRNLALTCFLINIAVAKIAKLWLIRRAINYCFKESQGANTRVTKDDLASINLHIAELTNLWHENTFIYPITECMAQKVYTKFEIYDLKNELEDLQKSFERYMAMFLSNEETKNENKKQKIFKILTVLSGLSTICTIVTYLFSTIDNSYKLGILFGGIALLALIVYILPGTFKKSPRVNKKQKPKPIKIKTKTKIKKKKKKSKR